MAKRDSTRVLPHTCVTCGALFTPIKLLMRKGGRKYAAYSGAKTCSSSCEFARMRTFDEYRAEATRRAACGPKNHNWKGGVSALYRGNHGPEWPAIAERVRIRDNYTCQRCSVTQADFGGTLHVHHKVPAANFSERKAAHKMSNLVTLCPPCHFTVEAEISMVQMPLPFSDNRHHRKGRNVRGDEVAGSKLTERVVLEMRRRYATGAQTRELAHRFGVTQSSAWAVVTGKTWKHVSMPSYSARPASKPGPKPKRMDH